MQYRFDGGVSFGEQIQFPPLSSELNTEERRALEVVLRLVFLLAGVSYFKAYFPTSLRCDAFDLDQSTANFISKVYRLGLAECAFRNGIPPNREIQIETSKASQPNPARISKSAGVLVPVGGGKDSIVTIETLRAGDISPTLFVLSSTVVPPTPIKDTIARSEFPVIQATRTLSAELTRINKQGAYNGHVPITAIVSGVAIATAIMTGIHTVIMSNESSASEGNTIYGGEIINHQYSKSWEFEQDLSRYLQEHVSPDIQYFSLLRPLTEIEIARRFVRHEKYFDVFRSCNTAFKQGESERMSIWCCQCPKCRFVFLVLAPFLAKERLIGIFGENLLNDIEQESGFAELCGLTAHKPFECVGEIEESRVAMQLLARSDSWRDDIVVAKLTGLTELYDEDFELRIGGLLPNRTDHSVPPEYLKLLDASR